MNVIRLRLPSLRERKEDIPVLARFFLAKSAKQLGVDVKKLSDTAMHYLSTLEFPGNVRQLENLCNWITVMAPGQLVEITDLPSDLTKVGDSLITSVAQDVQQDKPVIAQSESQELASHQPAVSPMTSVFQWYDMLESEAAAMLTSGEPEVIVQLGKVFEATVIKAALRHTHGRKNEAAIKLGIGRNTITRKIQELHILGAREEGDI